MDQEAEEQLIQEATAASLEEYDLDIPLEQQGWWKRGEDWMWQDQKRLREWHKAQWASLGRRWK